MDRRTAIFNGSRSENGVSISVWAWSLQAVMDTPTVLQNRPSVGLCPGLGQCLFQICHNVIHIFQTHRKPHHARCDTSLVQLGIRKLAVGGAGRMQHTTADVGHMHLQGDELERVDETGTGLPPPLEREGNNAAATIGQIFVGQSLVGVAGQTRVIDRLYRWMPGQPGRHTLGIAAVFFHPQGQGLQTLIDVKGPLRALAAAHIPHQLHPCLDNVGSLAKGLCINKAVVGCVRLHKFGKTPTSPVKITTVNNNATHLQGVAVHIFRCGMDNDIRPVFKRTAQHGRGKGIIHYQRHTVLVGQTGKAFNVQHIHGGIGQGLAKKGAGIGAHQCFNVGIGSGLIHKAHFNAQLFQGDGKKVEGAAVNVGRTDDMVTTFGDVEQGEHTGGLAGGGTQGPYPALKSRNFLLHRVHRGVGKAGIKKARAFKVKEFGDLGCGGVLEGGTLADGHNAGLAVFRAVASMETKGFEFHGNLVQWQFIGAR